MKFIHIADVHWGMKPDRDMHWSEDRYLEIKTTFQNVIKVCNEEEIDFLFIAGDFFHRQPLLRDLKEVNYEFSKLTHTKVLLIAGNHDYIGEHSHYQKFGWCPQVFILKDATMGSIYFPEQGLQVYGFSYHQRDIMENCYQNAMPKYENRINVLLAHGGDERNVPIDRNNLKSLGYDYVALGHIHKPEFIAPNVAYSGSLEPLDKNETGSHGYIYGEITRDKKVSATFVPFAKREYIHLTLMVEPEQTFGEILDLAREKVAECGMAHIYKITLNGRRDPDISIEVNPLYLVGNVLDVVDETVPDYDFGGLLLENKDNLIGMYINQIRNSNETDEVIDKALYFGIEALLKTKG